jgi:hypothetical protein
VTRLATADLAGIGEDWTVYDRRLAGLLGVDLLTLAARAVDRPANEVRARLAGRRLAAVSLSGGEGVVGGFAAALAAIGRRLGLIAEVMPAPDEAGLAQARAWGADFIIHADDERFLARATADGRTADNNPATSRVFAAALELLSGGSLAGREVVVLGLGVIGRGAASRLAELGAVPLMYDPDPRTWPLAEAGAILAAPADLARALARTDLIFEATPVALALQPSLWPDFPIVAAPGVPLAWPAAWLTAGSSGRLWHDPLQSGAAAMLAWLA